MTLSEIAALATAGGLGAVLKAGADHLLARFVRRDDAAQAVTVATIADRQNVTDTVFGRARELEKRCDEQSDEISALQKENALQHAELAGLRTEVSALRAQVDAQAKELHELTDVIRRLSNQTGRHPAAS